MNPWWLRPPAEEAPSKDDKPSKSPARPREKKEPETREKQSAPSQRRSGRGRGSKRRSSPAGKTQPKTGEQRQIAVFYDLDDIACGLGSADLQELDLDMVLRRLAEKGQVVVKKAYGDMQRYSDQEAVVRSAGLEIVDIPRDDGSGGGVADMRLALDAAELCFSSKPFAVFVLVSGNGGLVPLVRKLREAKAEVLGLGIRGSVSPDLEKSCDDYLYHDGLVPQVTPEPVLDGVDKEKAPVFSLLVETIEILQAGDGGILWGSTLKQEMRRRHPDLDVSELGYATFTDLLEDAERHQVIHLERDDRSGGYYVAGIAGQ